MREIFRKIISFFLLIIGLFFLYFLFPINKMEDGVSYWFVRGADYEYVKGRSRIFQPQPASASSAVLFRQNFNASNASFVVIFRVDFFQKTYKFWQKKYQKTDN